MARHSGLCKVEFRSGRAHPGLGEWPFEGRKAWQKFLGGFTSFSIRDLCAADQSSG